VRGTLIENVSLGLAMCSERVALFTAVVEGITPKVLALSSERTDDELTFPCGACLQVALEIAGPELAIVAVDTEGASQEMRLHDLLPRAPHRFTPVTAPPTTDSK
jgi:cytidine deaminase